ncbi:hypothetical protein SLEP1_g44461 [Rubroshorea leprosula]|uniref:Uncharacterized protein n=1 Tax=Rubroshorea leprosula TaxID=152421 RepID=A0AAV5LGT5_9ROSI|nr:hypothetical protein SLEP1_g44461 [Rubroshorea leprosula]
MEATSNRKEKDAQNKTVQLPTGKKKMPKTKPCASIILH